MEYKTCGDKTEIQGMSFYNTDCINLLKETPNNYYELAIVDPPYGIGINHNMGRRKGDKPSEYKKVEWDNEIPSKKYFDELERVSKKYIIFGGNYFTEYLKPRNSWIIWEKMNDGTSFSMAEMAYTNLMINTKVHKLMDRDKTRVHPTQKPVSLYRLLLNRYAFKGDKILDTHLGSGSIAIACHYMGFNLTACELDEEYFEQSMERIRNQTLQTTLSI